MDDLKKYSHCKDGQNFLDHLEQCKQCQEDIQNGIDEVFKKFPMLKMLIPNLKLFGK
jgi:hypothetical protein